MNKTQSFSWVPPRTPNHPLVEILPWVPKPHPRRRAQREYYNTQFNTPWSWHCNRHCRHLIPLQVRKHTTIYLTYQTNLNGGALIKNRQIKRGGAGRAGAAGYGATAAALDRGKTAASTDPALQKRCLRPLGVFNSDCLGVRIEKIDIFPDFKVRGAISPDHIERSDVGL